MQRPSVLVVYFSRSGHTRRLAAAIARALGADLEEIRDRADRQGLTGFVRCELETILGVTNVIERPRHDPARYDLVVVGGPVWMASVSTPVRTFLWLERERLPKLAFFVTLGGIGSDRAFGQMRKLAGKAPLATLAVREGELADGVAPVRVRAFADALRAAVKTPARRRRSRPPRVTPAGPRARRVSAELPA
ncbi:flavodoxin family protein [Anaeromyxobacter terrae]|uniref:flavodoxin family protein n=1 Tax=Anaeromyxobacter terrae TaxID=2925406 RepID=UPI001F55F107|nr:flavodoxin [Anaeromyxobacter sp. SG22]